MYPGTVSRQPCDRDPFDGSERGHERCLRPWRAFADARRGGASSACADGTPDRPAAFGHGPAAGHGARSIGRSQRSGRAGDAIACGIAAHGAKCRGAGAGRRVFAHVFDSRSLRLIGTTGPLSGSVRWPVCRRAAASTCPDVGGGPVGRSAAQASPARVGGAGPSRSGSCGTLAWEARDDGAARRSRRPRSTPTVGMPEVGLPTGGGPGAPTGPDAGDADRCRCQACRPPRLLDGRGTCPPRSRVCRTCGRPVGR